MTFTLVADVYPQQQATKIISYLVLAFAIMPGFGTTIGGFLVENFHWNSCFYFLAIYGMVLGLLIIGLPETTRCLDNKALTLVNIIQSYLHQAHAIKDWY